MPWVHPAGVLEMGAEASRLHPVTSITHDPGRGGVSASPRSREVGQLCPRIIFACRFLSGWPSELHLCLPQGFFKLPTIFFINLFLFKPAQVDAVGCTRVTNLNSPQLSSTLHDLMDCSHQVPLSTGFSRQKYWRGCRFVLGGSSGLRDRTPHLLRLAAWQGDS